MERNESWIKRIKIHKVDNVRLIDRYNTKSSFTGTLFLTASHLVFKDPEAHKEVWLFYSHISNIEKLSLTTSGSPILIRSKTFISITFIIPKDRDCHDVYTSLQSLASPNDIKELYCFHCKSLPENIPITAGWNFYDLQSEYHRMHVPNSDWCLSLLNHNYDICDTYPQYIYVPKTATNTILWGSAKFRSKGRLPVLSYIHRNKAVICRCSQPLSGFSARCVEDEQLLNCILQCNPNCNYMYVVDTRPMINAMANRATGKGYENKNFYDNIKFQFFGIENIHVMRNSLLKLIETCDLKSSSSVNTFLSGIEASGWLKHIKSLLDAALFMAEAIDNGISVLVHCSDGWDRTAQVCSLSTVLLDPFYRTIQGYQMLIEKDWLAFGHKFTDRYGFLAGDPREISPIFTQFIDATWQLCNLFPQAFQYNEKYLLSLHDNFTSCQFGTFIGNSEKERHQLGLHKCTFSYWAYVANHMSEYVNPLYSPDIYGEQVLKPDLCAQNLRFWRGSYCRFENGVHPRESLDEIILATSEHNSSLEDHINNLSKKVNIFKQMITNSKDKIREFVENKLDNVRLDAAGTPSVNRKIDAVNEEVDDFVKNDSVHYRPDDLKEDVFDSNPMSVEWQNPSSVQQCSCMAQFDYSMKKYHCRQCGNIFCVRCMHNQQISLPGHQSKRTVPVCKGCYFEMMGSSFEEDIA